MNNSILIFMSAGSFRIGHGSHHIGKAQCTHANWPESSQKVITGAPDRFTGLVRVQSLFDAKDQARTTGGEVTFEPGTRAAWHTHPRGQILIVTDGVGWVQQWGGPIQAMRKGDVIWIPAGVKHWHGATPTSSVTHLAIQENLDGRNVDWLETVSDEQYQLAK